MIRPGSVFIALLILVRGAVPVPAAANPAIPISSVSLIRESVRMEVTPDSLIVHGLYSFKRLDSPTTCAIYFPFPRDSVLARPRLLHATLACGGQAFRPVVVDNKQTPWFLEVSTGEPDTFVIAVSYSQSVERNAAVYPLTLRYPWFIPAEWIQIKVLMPMGFSQVETSLPCSLSTDESGSLLYTWSSSNGALPDHDMVVLWQPRAETTDRNKER